MALKHILVHLDQGRGTQARIDLAVRLARPHDAHLTGLYIRIDRAARFAPGMASAELTSQIRRMVAEQTDQQKQEESALVDRFARTAADAGLAADHRVESAYEGGSMVSHLVEHARATDLVVLGKPDSADSPYADRSMPHDVLFGSGVPVIVVPASASTDAGRNVVIAWNGSREAARAVKDALPILERADKVTVLCIEQGRTDSNIHPADALARHLGHHGIRPQLEQGERKGRSIGDAILSRIAELRADLLVMGAYGHSRLREVVLGGVTRRILDRTTVPVLMSH